MKRQQTARCHFPLFLVLALVASSPGQAAPPVSRVQRVRATGVLTCGVDGDLRRMDIDFCAAIAASLFGDATRVRLVSVSDIQQFLSRNDIDVVFQSLTWTLGRELRWNIRFGPVTYFDGLAFAVRKSRRIHHILQLQHSRICVDARAPKLQALIRYLHRGSGLQLLAFPSSHQAKNAFLSGQCAALAGDASTLVGIASDDDPARFAILDDRVTQEPLAPIVRAKDDDLLTILRWVIYTTIRAEELGIDSRTPSAVILRSFPTAARLARLGVCADWPVQVIHQIGNYGEIFSRNLEGPDEIKQKRGLNRLWRDGGLMFAPPFN